MKTKTGEIPIYNDNRPRWQSVCDCHEVEEYKAALEVLARKLLRTFDYKNPFSGVCAGDIEDWTKYALKRARKNIKRRKR